jgi:hypothetical protein
VGCRPPPASHPNTRRRHLDPLTFARALRATTPGASGRSSAVRPPVFFSTDTERGLTRPETRARGVVVAAGIVRSADSSRTECALDIGWSHNRRNTCNRVTDPGRESHHRVKDRAQRYRELAAETRAFADTMTHEQTRREAMLAAASVWDRLAELADREGLQGLPSKPPWQRHHI